MAIIAYLTIQPTAYCVDASIQGLKNNIKNCKERIITAASKITDNIKTNRTTKHRKQK